MNKLCDLIMGNGARFDAANEINVNKIRKLKLENCLHILIIRSFVRKHFFGDFIKQQEANNNCLG